MIVLWITLVVAFLALALILVIAVCCYRNEARNNKPCSFYAKELYDSLQREAEYNKRLKDKSP